jgi:NADH-quinone oxidoreductase subunit J
MALFGGAVVFTLFLKILFDVSYGFEGGRAGFPPIDRMPQGDVWEIGMTLFGGYNLPLQVVGALVLVASIGVVLLSKRELK